MSTKKDVLDRLDVKSLLLQLGVDIHREAGLSIHARCPLHDDSDPSFRIDVEDGGDHAKGKWVCFAGCGHGDIFDLIQKMGRASSFKEALSFAAAHAGVEQRPRRRKVLEPKREMTFPLEVLERSHKSLLENEDAMLYLTEERGIAIDQIVRRKIGLYQFRSKSSIGIPFIDPNGQCHQIRHSIWPRSSDHKGPRYWWTKGAEPRIWPEGVSAKMVLVVESEFDAMLLHSLGYAAVATCGTSLMRLRHLEQIQAESIVVIADFDEAGEKAMNNLAAELVESPDRDRFSFVIDSSCEVKDVGDFYKISGANSTKEKVAEWIDNRFAVNWRSRLRRSKDGRPLNTPQNRRIAWENFTNKPSIWVNDMGGRLMVEQRDFRDSDLVEFQNAILDDCDVYVTTQHLWEFVGHEAEQHRVHPVRCYLESLIWDGEPRIDSLLGRAIVPEKHCDNALCRSMVRKWMISAVARVMQPGCKADSMLVLISERQGVGKSTFGSIMGRGSWFTDQDIDPASKDSVLHMHENWIVEFSELDATTRRKDVSQLRAFLSRQVDSIRAAYRKAAVRHPRSFVFLGTTNEVGILPERDGRRYWPVEVSSFDLEWLEENADQLWSEAVQAYRCREPWHLSLEQEVQRAEHNEEHFRDHTIDELLNQVAKNLDLTLKDKGHLPTAKIHLQLTELGVRIHPVELGRTLRKAGWTPYRTRKDRGWIPPCDR